MALLLFSSRAAEIKREEMVRYAKANKDPEFQKMINVRGLGPEQEESQTKLRKQLQVCITSFCSRHFAEKVPQIVGDRVQQLEDVFESQRKRLEMHRTGRHRIECVTITLTSYILLIVFSQSANT